MAFFVLLFIFDLFDVEGKCWEEERCVFVFRVGNYFFPCASFLGFVMSALALAQAWRNISR